MTTPLRVGVWGVGLMGERHARVLSTLPDARLVAVYDANADRAQAVATRYGTQVASSPEALLAEVDAISIATPTPLHFAHVEQSLSLGKHVLVEKPIALSSYQAEAIYHEARKSGVSFAFIKATEGGDVADPMFLKNWINSARAGVARGGYHYYYFCRSAEEQARVERGEALLHRVVGDDVVGSTLRKVFVEVFDHLDRRTVRFSGRGREGVLGEIRTAVPIRVGIQDRYDSDPGPARRNDLNYYATLGFTF